MLVDEFQVKLSTHSAGHRHVAPVHSLNPFLLKWNETQIPKNTQTDQLLPTKRQIKDQAGPFISGIIWEQSSPDLPICQINGLGNGGLCMQTTYKGLCNS